MCSRGTADTVEGHDGPPLLPSPRVVIDTVLLFLDWVSGSPYLVTEADSDLQRKAGAQFLSLCFVERGPARGRGAHEFGFEDVKLLLQSHSRLFPMCPLHQALFHFHRMGSAIPITASAF